jgi:hypothetical protein
MYFSILPDVAGPEALLISGLPILAAFIVSVILIGLLEAAILVRTGWGEWSRSLLACFLMNLASAVLGLAFLFVVGSILSSLLRFLASFVVSWLVESGVLMLMRRDALRQNLVSALAANLASYFVIWLIYLVFLQSIF